MNWILNKSRKGRVFQAAGKMEHLHFNRCCEKGMKRNGRKEIEQPNECGLRGDIWGMGYSSGFTALT